MKKTLITMVIAISTFSLVSCGNKVVDQNTISNKYPIEEYLKKGATLDNYQASGTAIMKDAKGERFFAGYDSTYKVELSEEGIILPYIVSKGNVYYFENKIEDKNIPNDLNKLSGIHVYGNNLEIFLGKNSLGIDYTKNLTVYDDEKDSNSIYTTCNGVDGYQVWSHNKK